jgi:hypothetical protein
MARQTVLSRKKRGPPATGKGTLIGVRVQPPSLTLLDAWIGAQGDKPSRPEAIRRLVELALNTTSPKGVPLNAVPANIPKDLAKRIDRWAKTMGKAHSEAMRHLLEIGLSAPKANSKK